MLSGSRKFVLIAVFTALVIGLVNLIWWFSYRRTEQMLDEQLGRRLTSLAQAAAVAFSPQQIDSLLYGNLEAYLETIAALQSVRLADSLSEVFILDENYYYLATTLLEPDSVYFLAAVNGPFVDSVIFSLVAGAASTPTYHTGKLYLKSAFAPLIGSDGIARAVLGVEADVDYFASLTSLRQNLYYASGLSLLGGILLGALFLLLQRRISAAEARLFLAETHAHLGRMVAVVAHELKNPLMIIRGSAERIARKTDQEEAGYVIEEVDRLNDIVTGYLDFARAGGSLLASDIPRPIDIGSLLAGIRKHLTDRYADHSITWLGQTSPPALELVGYARSLRQVLLNLLFNSVESCLQAGKPIEVGLSVGSEGDRVVFSVVDHGAGLTRKEQKKVL